jgi:hypothetical protein
MTQIPAGKKLGQRPIYFWVPLQKVHNEKPKQDDPAGMLSKLCSGYRSLSHLLKPSEGK